MNHKIFYYSNIESPVGPLTLVSSQQGLMRVTFSAAHKLTNFTSTLKKRDPESEWIEDNEKLREVILQLQEYFEGKRKTFSLELDLKGTPFQIQVWQTLQKVPYGETSTYGEIANRIGSPNASRAVGNACRANPIPIIIPCHRIIGKNGQLTGFAGGLEIKRKLLELETKK